MDLRAVDGTGPLPACGCHMLRVGAFLPDDTVTTCRFVGLSREIGTHMARKAPTRGASGATPGHDATQGRA